MLFLDSRLCLYSVRMRTTSPLVYPFQHHLLLQLSLRLEFNALNPSAIAVESKGEHIGNGLFIWLMECHLFLDIGYCFPVLSATTVMWKNIV